MVALGIAGIADAEPIGSGGNATVFRARETDHDRWVAIKVLRGADEASRRRFERERKAMGRLSDHEGIVTVYQSGFTDRDDPYLVMPLYQNGSLQSRLDQSGPLDWSTACGLMVEVAETLHFAHDRGVVHRDLKPDNILISASGRPHIADFGISQFTGASASVGSVALTFTPSFCPPEVIEGAEPWPGADVYGLGATLFALVSGAAPYSTTEGESIFSVMRRIATEPVADLRHRGVPDPVATVVERAMAKDPAARIQTASEFAAAVRAAAASTSAPPPTQPTVSVSPPPAQTGAATSAGPQPIAVEGHAPTSSPNRRPALVAVAALVFAIAGLVAAFLATRDTGDGVSTGAQAAGTPGADQEADDNADDTADDTGADGGEAEEGGDSVFGDREGDGAGDDPADDNADGGDDPADDSAATTEGNNDGTGDDGDDAVEDDGGDDLVLGDDGSLPDIAGTTVTIWGPAAEEVAVRSGLAAFAEAAGVTIEFIGTNDLNAELSVAIALGDTPDIAIVGNAALFELARNGDLVPIPDRVVSAVADGFDAGWFEAGSVAGVPYGMPHSGEAKSLVWYNPTVFDDRGYQLPVTWEELEALSQQMLADGVTPWCVGVESGGATGWVFTDWMEDAMLRLHGPVTYDRWVDHAIPFTAPEVADAAQLVADIWFDDDNVVGGRDAILSTSWDESGLGILDGSCGMHRQAMFYEATMVLNGGEAGTTFDVFYLPPVDDRFGQVMVATGSHAVTLADRPEVMAVLQHFGTADYASARLASGAIVAPGPNRGIDLSLFTSPVSRRAHGILIAAGPVRFDASDVMPGEVGAGSFWEAGTAFVSGESTLEEFLATVEASWPG